MKKKILIIFAAAVAGALVLTACTSSEQGTAPSSGTQDGNTGTQAGSQSVSGVQTGSPDSSASDASDSQVSGSGQAADNSGSVSDGNQDISGTVQEASETGDSPEEDGEPVGDVIPDEDAEAAENDTEDPALAEGQDQGDEWSGTYIGDEETVTISMTDPESISFSFAQSGISGTAAVKDYQAVYNGDDHHVVVFNLNNDTVDVSVSSEEDYDASSSPLIGHYVRE